MRANRYKEIRFRRTQEALITRILIGEDPEDWREKLFPAHWSLMDVLARTGLSEDPEDWPSVPTTPGFVAHIQEETQTESE